MDHYATLGVSRTSEDVVIRAAYLALMRRYHPDTNPSPDAAERVREVTTAYDVLSDPHKRTDYDRRRDFDQPAAALFERPKRPRVGPIFFAATMILLSMAVLGVWLKPSGTTSRAEPIIAAASTPGATLTPAACIWPDATASIGRELVRQAASLRAVDRRALALIAPQMVVRISPALAGRASPETSGTNCNAAVELILPVGVTLPDGRQTVSGEIAYSVRNEGKRSPRVTYAAADDIAAQLASLRQPPPPNEPTVAMADATPELIEPAPVVKARSVAVATTRIAARPAPLRPVAARPAPAPSPTLRTAAVTRPAPAPRPAIVKAIASSPPKPKPDSGCDKYGTRWTELMCEDKSLVALDQQVGALDAQSWSRASAQKREQLKRSQDQFSATRIQCTTDACLRQAYLGRMKAVADIMAQSPPAGVKKATN